MDWRSSYSVPTPIVGGPEELILKPLLARGFHRVLEDVERILSAADNGPER